MSPSTKYYIQHGGQNGHGPCHLGTYSVFNGAQVGQILIKEQHDMSIRLKADTYYERNYRGLWSILQADLSVLDDV